MVSAPQLPEGAYWLEVAALRGMEGPFRLEAVLEAPQPAPSNDTCAAAEVIDLTTTFTANRSGTTVGANDDFDFSCGGQNIGTGADVAYDVRTPPRGLLELDALPSTPDFDPLLRRSTLSCSQSSGWSCQNDAGVGAAESVAIRLTTTTLTHVYVDGVAGSRGAFTFNARFTPPPSNDTCVLPLPVLAPAGTAHVLAVDSAYVAGSGGGAFSLRAQ